MRRTVETRRLAPLLPAVASILTSATWRSSIASLSPRRAPYEGVSPAFFEEELFVCKRLRFASVPRALKKTAQRRSVPIGSLEKKDEHRRI